MTQTRTAIQKGVAGVQKEGSPEMGCGGEKSHGNSGNTLEKREGGGDRRLNTPKLEQEEHERGR